MKIKTQKVATFFTTIGWVALGVLFLMGFNTALIEQEGETINEVEYHLKHLTDGNDLITVDEIRNKVFEVYDIDLVGVKLDHLDLEELEKYILEEAFIVRSDAYLDSKNVLHIDICQRTPVMRVMSRDGSDFYLDADGVKLPLSKHFTARVPVVTGAVANYTEDFLSTKNNLKSAFDIVMASRSDVFLGPWLESIHVHRNHELWLNGNVGNFKVQFGDGESIPQKITKMRKFFQQGLAVTGWKNIESIRLDINNQVVVKTRSKA